MLIAALDPGPTHSALVRWDTMTQRITSHAIFANTSPFLSCLGMNGEVVVIEDMVGYGQRVGGEVFLTCKWIGRFWATCLQHHHTPTFLSRPQVLKLLGIGVQEKGKDALVRGMLIARFGGTKARAIGLKQSPGPLYGIHKDEWSALALALAYVEEFV